MKNIFADEGFKWNDDITVPNVHIAHGDDYVKLEHCEELMELNDVGLNKEDKDCFKNVEGDRGVVVRTDNMDIVKEHDARMVNHHSDFSVGEHVDGIKPSLLLKDQCYAYDIISSHPKQRLSSQNLSQLLMIIAGNVGKSNTIESIT